MTPEEQRMAIAEACGWKRITEESLILGIQRTKWMKPGHETDHGFTPPDYLNDLNAMHEAEKVLTYEQLPWYVAILKNPVLMKDEGVSDFDIVHATAAQRAEAFLRTLGKWIE